MILAGHVLIGDEGSILGADVGFGELLKACPHSLPGRRILDITAPADREECCRAMEGLRVTRRPFTIVKRLVRDDASLIWVRNSVSIMAGAHMGPVVATCTAVPEDPARRSPAALLDAARFMRATAQGRDIVCEPQLTSAPGWDALLEIYIAEAEGRSIDVPALAGALRQSEALVRRWVAALVSHNVVEVETRDPMPDAEKAYRLTASTIDRLERYLIKFGAALLAA